MDIQVFFLNKWYWIMFRFINTAFAVGAVSTGFGCFIIDSVGWILISYSSIIYDFVLKPYEYSFWIIFENPFNIKGEILFIMIFFFMKFSDYYSLRYFAHFFCHNFGLQCFRTMWAIQRLVRS